METKEHLEEWKNRLISSIGIWADGRIEAMASKDPKMTVAAIYLKRGVKNYLAKEGERLGDMIDRAALFICDEQGDVDTTMLFNDLLVLFKSMDEIPFSGGMIHGSIGKGAIRIQIPDHPLASLLFGNKEAIRITDEDFLELKELLVAD